MMKTINVNEAIKLAAEEESLEGFAIKDLKETQVKAKDALLLARNGILIPEQNILYRDEDVEYDSEFDDYEWTQLPKDITIEELSKLSENHTKQKNNVLNIEIELEDKEALVWAEKNYPLLKELFSHIFKGFYTKRSLVED
jgi:hypothetical protein